MSIENDDEDIELVFAPSRQVKEGMRDAGVIDETVEKIKLDVLVKKFKNYHVDSIELSIGGVIKSEGLTKLFVPFEGSGGCKVVLKPKT